MKNKKNVLFSLIIMLAAVANFTANAQDVESKYAFSSQAPKGIVRNIKQDKKGNVWVTSWEGVYKYDTHLPDGQGKSFTNVTSKVSSARFFSVLEDSKGNLWFGSIGSGVYYYDGKSFQNFTTKEGLASDSVTNIYEDKTGTIWFGTDNGVSLYDGKSFRNLKMNEARSVTETDSVYVGSRPVPAATDSVQVSAYQNILPKDSWMHNDVNAIIEDNKGKFWLATRGNAVIYDGKTFTTITNNDKPFTNVRSIIKDKKGNIWLGGYDGLWRYDGRTFTNFTRNFVGYIYEDKKGNIWTSSGKDGNNGNAVGWALSWYDAKPLVDNKPTATEIATKPMLFGILEDDKGNIWFGALDGVYRYDGKIVTAFKVKNN